MAAASEAARPQPEVLLVGPGGDARAAAAAQLGRLGVGARAASAAGGARGSTAGAAVLLPGAGLADLGVASTCPTVVVADIDGSADALRAWVDATAASAGARTTVRFAPSAAAAAAEAAVAAGAPPPAKRRRADKYCSKTDWSDVRFRHVALLVWYDGKAYKGFASQSQGEATVEGELMSAIEAAGLQQPLAEGESRWDSWGYSRCGRTDRGVSAAGQVLTLRLRSKHREGGGLTTAGEAAGDTCRGGGGAEGGAEGEWAPTAPRRTGECRAAIAAGEPLVHSPPPDGVARAPPPLGADELDYVSMLNAKLPDDVRVLGWRAVPADFSARFSCGVREYRYYFDAEGLDLQAMADGAQRLRGAHDFRNFCKMDVLQVHNYRREIFECAIDSEVRCSDVAGSDDEGGGRGGGGSDGVGEARAQGGAAARALAASGEALAEFGSARSHYILVRGSAFLWHQVRCIAAVLLLVGQGLEAPGVVDELLASERKPNYSPASEAPLVLSLCSFADPSTEEGANKGLSFWCSVSARTRLRQHFEAMEAALQTRRCVLRSAWLHQALGSAGGGTVPLRGRPKHVKLMARAREATYEERREQLVKLGKLESSAAPPQEHAYVP